MHVSFPHFNSTLCLLLALLLLAAPGFIRALMDASLYPSIDTRSSEVQRMVLHMENQAQRVREFVLRYERLPTSREISCTPSYSTVIIENATCTGEAHAAWRITGTSQHFQLWHRTKNAAIGDQRSLGIDGLEFTYNPVTQESNYDDQNSWQNVAVLLTLQLFCSIAIMIAPVAGWLKLRRAHPHYQQRYWYSCVVIAILLAFFIPNIL